MHNTRSYSRTPRGVAQTAIALTATLGAIALTILPVLPRGDATPPPTTVTREN